MGINTGVSLCCRMDDMKPIGSILSHHWPPFNTSSMYCFLPVSLLAPGNLYPESWQEKTKQKLASLILSLGPLAFVFAVPTPLASDGSVVRLYIDDPVYYHEVVETYPRLFSFAGNTITTATPLITPPSASISFHASTPVLSPPEFSTPGCQYYCGGFDTAQIWFRWAYQAWMKQATMVVKTWTRDPPFRCRPHHQSKVGDPVGSTAPARGAKSAPLAVSSSGLITSPELRQTQWDISYQRTTDEAQPSHSQRGKYQCESNPTNNSTPRLESLEIWHFRVSWLVMHGCKRTVPFQWVKSSFVLTWTISPCLGSLVLALALALEMRHYQVSPQDDNLGTAANCKCLDPFGYGCRAP